MVRKLTRSEKSLYTIFIISIWSTLPYRMHRPFVSLGVIGKWSMKEVSQATVFVAPQK